MQRIDHKGLLNKLQWEEDQKVTNHFDESVWLRALFVKGKRIGITECCLTNDPCDWHKAVERK